MNYFEVAERRIEGHRMAEEGSLADGILAGDNLAGDNFAEGNLAEGNLVEYNLVEGIHLHPLMDILINYSNNCQNKSNLSNSKRISQRIHREIK